MAFTEKQLGQGLLGTAVVSLYTVPASTTGIVKNIVLTNGDSANRAATIWLVPSGAGESGTNVLINGASVPTNGVIDWEGFQPMNASGTIRGSASVDNQVTVTIGGAEIT